MFMKRLLAAVLTATVLLTALPLTAAAEEAVLQGDVNFDRSLNILDATMLYAHVSGTSALSEDALAVGDYNGDGSVNILDAMALYNLAAGVGSNPDTDIDGEAGSIYVVRDGITDETAYMQNFCVYNGMSGTYYRAATKEDLQLAVAQLVKYEMGMSSFGMNNSEAWKAMAVAAYTFVARHCFNGAVYEIYFHDINLENETDKRIYDAVGEVLGIKVAYNDAARSAFDQLGHIFYSASSAGVSCSTQTAWGYSHVECNPVVESPYDNENWINTCSGGTTAFVRTFSISQDDLYTRLANYFEEDAIYADQDDAEPFSLYDTEKSGPYWGATNLYYLKDDGSHRYIRGVELYAVIPGCKSHAITVLSEEDGVYTMESRGYGHGIGMSQYGAAGYANVAGWTYDMILAHYYGFDNDTAWGLVGPKW